VAGPPGVGKSALLAHARRTGADRGLTVLETVGVETEAELAYAALQQLIWPLMDRLEALSPPQADAVRSAVGMGPARPAGRLAVSVAALSLLSAAGERAPLLCLVDDAQWIDGPSLGVLAFVARRLEDEPVAVLFAVRTGDGDAAGAIDVPRLEVRGLDAGAAGILLAQTAPHPVAASVAATLVSETAGNPLAITELAHTLDADQLAGRSILPHPPPVGQALERIFAGRIEQLGPATRLLLLAAAAADSPEAGSILAAARLLGSGPVGLHEAERRALVRATPGGIVFRHPLIRSAVYHAATVPERSAAHRALAEVLSGDELADRRAWHRAAATLEPDDEIAAELERSAAGAMARGGHAAAARALRRAAELTTQRQERGRRTLASGLAAWDAGDGRLADALLTDATTLLDDPTARAHAALVRGVIASGRDDPRDAIGALVRAADDVIDTDLELGLDILVALATLLLTLPRAASDLTERVAALDDRRVDQVTLGFLQACERLLSRPLADSASLEPFVLPDRDLSPADGRRYAIAYFSQTHPTGNGVRPALLDRLARWVAIERRAGMIGPLLLDLIGLGFQQGMAGHYRGARVDLVEALTLTRDVDQPAHLHLTTTALTILEAFEGNRDRVIALSTTVLRSASPDQQPHIGGAIWARGLAALGDGDAETALTTLLPVGPGGEDETPWMTPYATPDLVEAARATDRLDVARRVADDFGLWAERFGCRFSKAHAARCEALLAERDADREAYFEHALALHAGTNRPFDLARTQLLHGEYLRRARQRRASREQLGRALGTFERLGATAFAARAARELRATGSTPRARAPSTLDELTPQELHVAGLVALGHTNKDVGAQLFISPRTVSSHLRRVFEKLGITNRTQLARYDFDELPAIEDANGQTA
jgi:DNA-binding CsgD family transcriptional regulator